MHKLHEQFSLLSKYGITSITELTEARNVLDDRRKSINRKISAVRRAEKAAKNLFETVDVIKELAESENCYVRGDEFFKEETLDSIDDETLATIRTFFENNLNLSETSRQLYVHRNTLVYRFEKLQKKFGLDIRTFEDALTFKLAMMVVDYIKYSQNLK